MNMKDFRNSELFKRVVPLTLAAIVLAGTVLGIFGTIFAYAAEEDGNEKRKAQAELASILFYNDYDLSQNLIDNGSNKVKNPIGGNEYDVVIQIELLDQVKALVKNHEEEDVNPFESVELIPGHFTKNTSAWKFTFAEGPEAKNGKIYYYYLLRNVKAVEYLENMQTARMRVAVNYEQEFRIQDVRQDTITCTHDFDQINNSSGGSDWSDDDGVRNTSTTNSDSDAEVLTTPKMIVTGFDIPSVVNPGEEFKVTIEFMNNSKKKDMENVSMTLTASDGVAIKNGVNKRHYIKIPRRQSTSETFTLKSSKELKAESLAITVKFDFQYEVDNAYKDGSSEEVLSIMSIPKEEEEKEDPNSTEGSISSFEILSVVPPDSLYPNEDGYVTVKVINKDHQYDASNVQLTIVGDGLINSGNTEYHGALTHSTQAEIEMALQFAEAGTFNLQAIVTYEDSVGKDADGKPNVRINDITKDFTVTVQESPDMGMDMGMGDMMGMGGMEGFDENGMPVGGEGIETPWYKNPVILGCSGGGVLVAALAAVLIVRKVRKKKAGDDDEDI